MSPASIKVKVSDKKKSLESWPYYGRLIRAFWLQQQLHDMEAVRLQTLEIVTHDNRTHYETGDLVKGRCILALEGILLRRHVNVLFTCVGEIKWFEAGPHNRYHPHEVHEFHDKKVFMELLFKYPPECENDVLEAGVHSIDFEFELPRGVGLPSTFQGVHGTICYFLEANISEDLNMPPLYRTEPFIVQVAAPIRANIWTPIGTDTEKEVGYLNTGKVHLYASLVRKGWAPGEQIRVDVTVINESNSKLTPRATLYETRVFLAKNRHHSIEKHYDAITGTAVSKSKPGMEQLLLTIPEQCPLTIKNELMVVKYFVHVTLDIPLELDMHINLPIIVTTRRALDETRIQPLSAHPSLEINE